MSTSRTYGDACGIARALDILGERWALMTVRELLLAPPAASQVYELTDRGHELAPVLDALGTWGSRLPLPGPDATMSFDAHILSFRTLFRPDLAEGFSTRVELRLGERSCRATVADGKLELGEGTMEAPD